jgi:small subunit ribosomal protein S21
MAMEKKRYRSSLPFNFVCSILSWQREKICDRIHVPYGYNQLKCRSFPLLVHVKDNNVDQALRALKKKLQREGVFRIMKAKRFYEKPSEKRVREESEAGRRYRKQLRKRLEKEGY